MPDGFPFNERKRNVVTKESKPVAIIMGSQSDWATMSHAAETLKALGVGYEARIVSAHRTPGRLVAFAKTAERVGSGVGPHLVQGFARWKAWREERRKEAAKRALERKHARAASARQEAETAGAPPPAAFENEDRVPPLSAYEATPLPPRRPF